MSVKTVLVTGAAHRLGACMATLFAQSGWQVLCHYDQSQAAAQGLVQTLRAQGHAAQAVHGRLADEAGCRELMAQVRAHTGHLNALVNNASSFFPDTGLDFQLGQAAHQLQVNLLAPLLLASHMARDLVPAGQEGCAIHILDQKVYNLNPDYFSYTVSKLALERAVALQAQALAPHVRVCGVAPGLMFLSGPQSPENFERASRVNLLRRPIDPADVARTCLFLASTAGLTGTTLCVDNGQHLVPLARDVMFAVDSGHPPLMP